MFGFAGSMTRSPAPVLSGNWTLLWILTPLCQTVILAFWRFVPSEFHTLRLEYATHSPVVGERDHQILPLDAGRDQRLADVLEHPHAFGAFAGRQDDMRTGNAGGLAGRFGGGQVQRRDMLVGDNRHLGAGPQRGDAAAERGQKVAADQDVVAARTERDIDDDRLTGAERRGHGCPRARFPKFVIHRSNL